jgi:hypothetical protein
MARTARRRRPAAKIRCEETDRYGCPGGPAGDEFAPVVYVRCRRPATHLAKSENPWPAPGEPATLQTELCEHHAAQAAGYDFERVYRFRKV